MADEQTSSPVAAGAIAGAIDAKLPTENGTAVTVTGAGAAAAVVATEPAAPATEPSKPATDVTAAVRPVLDGLVSQGELTQKQEDTILAKLAPTMAETAAPVVPDAPKIELAGAGAGAVVANSPEGEKVAAAGALAVGAATEKVLAKRETDLSASRA